MIKEAEEFAEIDKTRKEEAEARNNADSLIYTAEKTKRDLGDKISKENTERIDKKMQELREAMSGKDLEKIKSKNEELAKLLQEVGTAVYQGAAQQAPNSKRLNSKPDKPSRRKPGNHRKMRESR